MIAHHRRILDFTTANTMRAIACAHYDVHMSAPNRPARFAPEAAARLFLEAANINRSRFRGG